MAKAKTDSKKIWERIGWMIHLNNAVDSKAFGSTLAEVENSDCEKVLEYFSTENGKIV